MQHRKRGQPIREPQVVYVERRVFCEVYSRVVGFLRPVQSWNVGKQQEWKERKTYDMGLAERRMDDEGAMDRRSYL